MQQNLGLANSSSGSTWQIVHRGTTYTVTATEASLNDTKDPPSDVVTVGGDANIQGGIDVDGLGTVNAGDSHKGNLTYDGTAFGTILVAGGAQPTPNTFRQLPTSQ